MTKRSTDTSVSAGRRLGPMVLRYRRLKPQALFSDLTSVKLESRTVLRCHCGHP